MYGYLRVKIVINHKIWGYSLILHSCENKFKPINQNSENSENSKNSEYRENSENSDVRFSDRAISTHLPVQATCTRGRASIPTLSATSPQQKSTRRPHLVPAKDWGYIIVNGNSKIPKWRYCTI